MHLAVMHARSRRRAAQAVRVRPFALQALGPPLVRLYIPVPDCPAVPFFLAMMLAKIPVCCSHEKAVRT